MDLRRTLLLAHDVLTQAGIDHALIGGLAMVNFGLSRATVDVDFMVDEVHKGEVMALFKGQGFTLINETPEVLQFSGVGHVDILLARRPISRGMMKDATELPQLGIKCLGAEDIIGLKIQAISNDPSREFQDKADIQFLIESQSGLDWEKIKRYADLFNKWGEIESIKAKAGL